MLYEKAHANALEFMKKHMLSHISPKKIPYSMIDTGNHTTTYLFHVIYIRWIGSSRK